MIFYLTPRIFLRRVATCFYEQSHDNKIVNKTNIMSFLTFKSPRIAFLSFHPYSKRLFYIFNKKTLFWFLELQFGSNIIDADITISLMTQCINKNKQINETEEITIHQCKDGRLTLITADYLQCERTENKLHMWAQYQTELYGHFQISWQYVCK